jgi:hypothetical protein
MCSAKRKDALKADRPMDWVGSEADWLYAHLSSCLHAMGQPLTVLRCTVAASAAEGITPEKLQKNLATSAEQVKRLCGLFDCLRELVDSVQLGGERTPVEVSRLLNIAVEDQIPLLHASGLGINVTIPAYLRSAMLTDMTGSLRALSSVLKTAASLSSQGDVIEVRVAPKNGGVELIVQNARARSKCLTPLERLNLAVAEASIRSQAGDYACMEDPFLVSLTLPAQSPAHHRVLNIAASMGEEARYRTMQGRLCS